jgi:hypothetical protein
MLVYGSAEPLRVGDSVTVDGRLRPAGRGEAFRICGLETVDGCGIKKMGLELKGIRPNTDPVPVTLRSYCKNPAVYSGNLVKIPGILHLSPAAWDGENYFLLAGDGIDSMVVYVDGDTSVEMGSGVSTCYTITGIVMKMHVPAGISSEPAWCIAPRWQNDVSMSDCSSDASRATWGEIKAIYSD